MDQIQAFEHGLQPFRNVVHAQADQHLIDRMHYYGVPGVSIAVINDGTLAWAQGYGVRDEATATPITPDTRFPVASLTKPIVGLAILCLVQQGILDLDVDVNHYLTSWAVPDTLYTQQSKVTLRGLLSHSAGTTTFGFWGYQPGGPIPTLLAVLDGLPPANSTPVRVATPPGSCWSYSSGGYCIIQQLLVDVLQRPFPALMADLIFSPLAMQTSIFALTPPPEQWEISAHGHDATGAPVVDRWRAHPELAAIGLWSTPVDIAKLGLTHFHGH
jgi:CubicO group peptidase (beta-lactamase class C family)